MGEREDDDRLMARVASGDADAFRQLVDRHADRVLALARRVLNQQADAEDVTQEVFTRLWTRADTYRPGQARFTTWLYRIVMNASLNTRRGPAPAASLDDEPEPATDTPGPDQAAANRQTRDRVDSAIGTLPISQRAAIALTASRELSNREAAAIMQLSVKALEALLVRARRSLRTQLGDLR